MEYCAFGDLSQFIKNLTEFNDFYGPDMARVLDKYPMGRGGGLHEYLVKHFLRQLGMSYSLSDLVSALRFLRSKTLIHRDLKPQNLLLVPPTPPNTLPVLKVADFGFSRYLPKTSLAETLCGSPLYMAPEILRCQHYGPEVDLWSVGTVLYEMLVGKPPFRAHNHVELLVRIDKANDRIRFPGERDGTGVSEPLKELCRGLLKQDPKDRMTFPTFFAHPCVQDEIVEPDPRLIRRSSGTSTTPPRSPREEDYFSATRLVHTGQRSPSHEAIVNLPQGRRVSPSYDVTGAPLQHRRVSLTSQRPNIPPLNVDTRASPALQYGSSPSSRYAPELERNPSLRGNSSNLGTSADRKGSPGSSFLQQRGTYRPRTPEEVTGAGTASLEVDYVLVESRRAVEVNALADELAYSPHRRTSESKPRYDQLIKRGTSYAIGNAGTSPVAATHQVRNPRGALTEQQRSVSAPVYPHVPGSQSPSPTGQGYIPSERRFGTSPSSALAKAISMASMKLFGASSPSPPYLPYSHPTTDRAIVKAGGVEEETAIKEIEDVALRSNVVYQFGEMKFSQIMPASSSTESCPSGNDRRDSSKNTLLTDEADATLCEEALVLYIKSLSLLQKSMDLAGRYWQRRGDTGIANPRLNNAVQWGRERFNETLEKADYVQSKIPENRGESNVASEKLIYDRALEMVCVFKND
jgi:serine/threonine-protein kinase ULK/ATG1